jgi:DNA-binding MarR family transcriptional regulator
MAKREIPGDYLHELGPLALVSRLRRLLGVLAKQGARVYAELDVDFEVRWFPILHLLAQHAPLSVTEIAEALGLTHPAVVQVVGDLSRRRLVGTRPDAGDRRRRELVLTRAGRRLVRRLEPTWHAFAAAGHEALAEGDDDLLAAIGQLEQAIARRSMYDRIMTRLADEASTPARRQSKRRPPGTQRKE